MDSCIDEQTEDPGILVAKSPFGACTPFDEVHSLIFFWLDDGGEYDEGFPPTHPRARSSRALSFYFFANNIFCLKVISIINFPSKIRYLVP